MRCHPLKNLSKTRRSLGTKHVGGERIARINEQPSRLWPREEVHRVVTAACIATGDHSADCIGRIAAVLFRGRGRAADAARRGAAIWSAASSFRADRVNFSDESN